MRRAVLLLAAVGAWQFQYATRGRVRVIRSESAEEEAPAAVDERDALRERIAELEDTARAKRSELERLVSLTDESGQNGYYRLAAQVEQFKRQTKGSAARSTERTKTTVFKTLVPVLEAIEEMDPEGQTKIQSSFHQVYVSILDAMKNMGLDEFYPQKGEPFDPDRHDADAAAGTVKSVTRPGFLLQSTGDIVRPAKCLMEHPAIEPPADETSSSAETHDDDDGTPDPKGDAEQSAS